MGDKATEQWQRHLQSWVRTSARPITSPMSRCTGAAVTSGAPTAPGRRPSTSPCRRARCSRSPTSARRKSPIRRREKTGASRSWSRDRPGVGDRPDQGADRRVFLRPDRRQGHRANRRPDRLRLADAAAHQLGQRQIRGARSASTSVPRAWRPCPALRRSRRLPRRALAPGGGSGNRTAKGKPTPAPDDTEAQPTPDDAAAAPPVRMYLGYFGAVVLRTASSRR